MIYTPESWWSRSVHLWYSWSRTLSQYFNLQTLAVFLHLTISFVGWLDFGVDPTSPPPPWTFSLLVLSSCSSQHTHEPSLGVSDCLRRSCAKISAGVNMLISTDPSSANTSKEFGHTWFLQKQIKMIQMGTILYVCVTSQWAELHPKLVVSRSVGLISVAMHLREFAHPSQTGCSQAAEDFCLAAFLTSFAQL